MTTRTLSAGRTPKIIIESAGGDLSIVGWDGEDLLIKSDEECRISQDGEHVVLICPDELALRVPHGASLQIQTVGGDLALRGVTGDVQILTAGGDVSLRDANNVNIGNAASDLSLRGTRGNVSIGTVTSDATLRDVQGNVSVESAGDDLVVRDVRGNVSIGTVTSDATLRDVQGNISIGSVGDDLVVRDVRGSLKVNVGEDVVVSLAPRAGNSYSVDAGDDVMLLLPPGADADLVLEGDRVIVNWPGAVEEEEGAVSRSLRLGRGGPQIAIHAGGEVRLASQDQVQQSPDEFGNFAGMMLDWSDFGAQMGARISRRVEAATKRAAQQAERAARKAESKLNAPHLRGRVNIGRWDWNFDSRNAPPSAPREPVSEGERMAILKMLAEKKITAAQADELLAALEGG